MSYRINVSRKAERDMMRLPYQEKVKIANRIDNLAADPRPAGCLKMKGKSEELWRIRSGNYRILYAIDDAVRIIEVRRI